MDEDDLIDDDDLQPESLTPEKMTTDVDKIGKRIMKNFDSSKQSYFKNVASSTKHVVGEYVGGQAPKVGKAIDILGEFRSEAQKFFREADIMKKIQDKKSGIDKGIKDIIKNSFDDMKSGDFAGSKRLKKLRESSNPFGGGDDFDSDFDSGGFDDDGEISTDVGAQIGAIEGAATTIAEAEADLHGRSEVAASTRHIERAALASKQTDYLGKIANVQEEYMTPMATKMQEFVDTATPLLTDMTTLMRDVAASSQRANAIEVWRATNMNKVKDNSEKSSFEEKFEDLTNFDIGSAKTNLKNIVDSSEPMEMYKAITDSSFGPNMIQQFIASPIGTLLPMMVPKIIGTGLQNINSMIESAVPKAMMGLVGMGREKGGVLGKLTGALGYNQMGIADIDLATTENLPSSWTSDDSTSLRVVIPSLLGDIKSAIDGSEPSVFDYRSGHFKTKRRVKAEYEEERDNVFKSSMSSKAFGDMNSIDNNVAERHGVEKSGENQALLRLAYGNIAKNALNLNTLKEDIHDQKEDVVKKLLEGYEGDLQPKYAAQRVNAMMQSMDDRRYDDLYGSVMLARKKAPKKHASLGDNMMSRGLNGAIGSVGWDNNDLDAEGHIKVGNKEVGPTAEGGYARRIYDVLVEGVGVYQVGKKLSRRLQDRLTSDQLFEVRKQKSVEERMAADIGEMNQTAKETMEAEKKARKKEEDRVSLEEAGNVKDWMAEKARQTGENVKGWFKKVRKLFIILILRIILVIDP